MGLSMNADQILAAFRCYDRMVDIIVQHLGFDYLKVCKVQMLSQAIDV